jgi:hypothetical protein
MSDFEPIVGRYLPVKIGAEEHRIFIEEAGSGIPLLCLHTAGNDSRQFRHIMNDPEITGRFRVIAFDLPFHGRSAPPDGWWLKKYRLTTDAYLEMIRAVWLALKLDRPLVMGCSMGGAIVLKLAAPTRMSFGASSAWKVRPMHPAATMNCCIIRPFTAENYAPATPMGSILPTVRK